ncbi:hypothetical protein [Actinoplanes sp. HUAS TT8]|uniref:hypothetical protein n=1 Tax=Actinoplanes sp. HUAS TT8 TaxID=3447453 RepID=UPI003F5211D8
MATGWLRRLRQVTGDGSGPGQRALQALDEAERAHEAGDPATAERLGAAAVAELRALGARVPEPLLARALLDRSAYLQELSRPAEAVETAEEAVTLARSEPGRAQSLVVALTTSAIRLLDADRPADAAEAAREALTISEVRPDPALARLLTDLAAALSRAGHPEHALAQSERAVTMWRTLSARAQEPGRAVAPGSEWGRALSDHAGLLYAAGRWADAIEYSAEAVAYWGGHAQSQPDRLALALTDHATMLRRVGRDEEALAAAAEAEALTAPQP